jgi:hypothetical protein
MSFGPNDPTKIMQELPAHTSAILHGLIALWGLLDCFFGFRIFRATMRLLMGFIFAVAAATLALRIVPESVPVFLVSCAVGLVLGFLVGWYVYKLGVVAMAVLGGFVLAAPFVSSLGANAFMAQCGVALACGLLTFLLLEPVVIASTALTGAFRVMFGVMFFFGGQSLMEYICGTKSFESLFVNMGKLPLVLTLLLAVVGCFVQFASWRGEHSKDEDEN